MPAEVTDHQVVSVSGGKDSTATLMLALDRYEPADITAVFADTGHEHPATYEYLDYIDSTLCPIRRVRGNFKARIAAKREYIVAKWARDGVPQARIDRALEVLVPTGNPFLDLCLWKGRFPSTQRRFCTQELKSEPITQQVIFPLLRTGTVLSWQGVRAQESKARANLTRYDATDPVGVTVYRPILHWTWEDVFALHRQRGVKWNPLYEAGLSRVGCMPCIHERKSGLAEIARRYPAELERVATWERLVSDAAKRGESTFYGARIAAKLLDDDNISHKTHGIAVMAEWSTTSHGGRQQDMLASMEAPLCSSVYGLCE